MRLPIELWNHPAEEALVTQLTELFVAVPLVLTDKLANTIYFNDRAENLFGDAGMAIVNRTVFSLLGIDDGRAVPVGLSGALLGTRSPWKAMVAIPGAPGGPTWCEASSIQSGGQFICGVLRFAGSKTDG